MNFRAGAIAFTRVAIVCGRLVVWSSTVRILILSDPMSYQYAVAYWPQLFSVDLIAAVVVLFRVPHTLLTPSIGVRWVDFKLCSLDNLEDGALLPPGYCRPGITTRSAVGTLCP